MSFHADFLIHTTKKLNLQHILSSLVICTTRSFQSDTTIPWFDSIKYSEHVTPTDRIKNSLQNWLKKPRQESHNSIVHSSMPKRYKNNTLSSHDEHERSSTYYILYKTNTIHSKGQRRGASQDDRLIPTPEAHRSCLQLLSFLGLCRERTMKCLFNTGKWYRLLSDEEQA